jgi:hypothetical protein
MAIVVWRDIVQSADWTEPSEIEPERFSSIGWVLPEKDGVLKQANTQDEDGNLFGVTAYPVGCVEQVIQIPFTYESKS